MTTFAALVAAEGAGHRELPIPPILIGVLALLAFAFLLGVTWSFRGTHNKYAAPRRGGAGHGDHGTGTDTPATREASHWPEHPGHH